MGKATSDDLTWEAFVRNCAAAFAEGVSESVFGSPLVGREVHWHGTVERADGRGKIVRGLVVAMRPVEVPLKDNWTFVGRSLFLRTERTQLISEKFVGMQIAFTGRFRDQGVFATVRFTPDDEQRKVFLSFGLEEGRILNQ